MTGYQFSPMLWPTLGSAAFIGGIAGYLWRRREETTGAFALSVVALLLVVWCLGAAAEVAAADPSVQRMWFVFRDALTLPGVVLAFWFALQYAGLERWLTRPIIAFLAVVVVAFVTFDLVDGGRLLWSAIWWDREIQGNRTGLGTAFGAFAITMFLLSTAVFGLLFIRSPAHRIPVALILFGQVAIRILYALGVFNVVYIPNIVSGVVGMDVIAAMYAIALSRFRLFDLVPIGRETILARMPDGLLLLDESDRIADVNDAAVRMLDLPRDRALHQTVSAVLAPFPDVVRAITDPASLAPEASIESEGSIRTFEVSSTPLADWQGRPIGRLVLLHDTSALRSVEKQLIERERALAGAEERERLARELHDGLAQDLWLAKLKTGQLAALPGQGSEACELTRELDEAVDLSLTGARQVVAALRLGEQSGRLRELLSRSLEDFEDRYGLVVEFECRADLPALPPSAETEILRIVHEALTNVRRHADATVVRVRIDIEDGRFQLVIGDNGRGFDPNAVRTGAYGLAGMRERASVIGGELAVDTAAQRGTRIRLVVPLSTSQVLVAATR